MFSISQETKSKLDHIKGDLYVMTNNKRNLEAHQELINAVETAEPLIECSPEIKKLFNDLKSYMVDVLKEAKTYSDERIELNKKQPAL